MRTFSLPDSIDGTHTELALEMISVLQSDGIFQITCDRHQSIKLGDTFEANRRFFAQPAEFKSRCVSALTYAGYAAADPGSEIFTVCQDIPLNDTRVRQKWPCHGPVPWPSAEYRRTTQGYLTELGMIGDKVLRLIALGLDLPIDTLTDITDDGWHHMRVLRSTANSPADPSYGTLLIAALDAVPNVLTVFPGDILQFLTEGRLRSTSHKTDLAEVDHCTMTYFHEPPFNKRIHPLFADEDTVHYGTHFTAMFMRCHPDRITTQRISAEDRLTVLADLADAAK